MLYISYILPYYILPYYILSSYILLSYVLPSYIFYSLFSLFFRLITILLKKKNKANIIYLHSLI